MIKNNKKGVLTIEADLIMPLVIYIIFLMIFMFLLIYSRVYVSLSVDHVAAEVTSQWYSRNSDFDTVKDSKKSIIASAFGTALSTNDKIDIVKTKLTKQIKSGLPVHAEFNSEITSSNFLIGQQLQIKTTCKYTLPIAGIFRLFSIPGDGVVTDQNNKVINLSDNEANMTTIKYSVGLAKGKFKKTADAILDEIKKKFKF